MLNVHWQLDDEKEQTIHELDVHDQKEVKFPEYNQGWPYSHSETSRF